MRSCRGAGGVTWSMVLVWWLAAAGLAGCGKSDKGKSSGTPPASLKTVLDEGKKLLYDGNRQGAIVAYSRAIQLDPKCKEAFLSRGVAYNESGDSKKALADFTKAIELDPHDSYPYEQRASIYEKVYRDGAKAAADRKAAEAIRQKRWEELPGNMAKLKKKMQRN
jgi:Tfp pilus assembly protein PilF